MFGLRSERRFGGFGGMSSEVMRQIESTSPQIQNEVAIVGMGHVSRGCGPGAPINLKSHQGIVGTLIVLA